MKYILACVILGFLVSTLCAVERVTVENNTATRSEPSDALRKEKLRFKAQLRPGEVLTVRVTRWEAGRKVLETEEILAAAGGAVEYGVTLSELAPDYWHLADLVAEQHLQGATLQSLKIGKMRIDLRLVSRTDPKRTYRFSWSAKVESWTVVAKRHEQLPELRADSTWHARRVIAAPALDARF